MNSFLSRRHTEQERGAATFLIFLVILIVVFAGALVLDIGVKSHRAQQLQNAADAAALAGVQAYRATGAALGDEAAADAEARNILRQNGIAESIVQNAVISFPDPLTNQEVTVTVTDPSSVQLFNGFTGNDREVERSATATFAACETSCSREVKIPAPFTTVDAQGEGDGYKPIRVGDRMYAINHNNNQIVCVDLAPPNSSQPQACWCRIAGTDDPCLTTTPQTQWRHTRYAYFGSGKWNPEMPHSAVFGTTIYWASSDSTGTYLFCWETDTESPCTAPYRLNTRPRATSQQIDSSKDRNRGGGVILFDHGTKTEVDDEIFVFTDDHKVHCFDPQTRARCSSYSGPVDTSLGFAGFPDNDPVDTNHGGSIDRIIDEDTKRIYSVIKIETQVPHNGLYDCSQNLQDIVDNRVVIELYTPSSTDYWISGNTTTTTSSDKTIRTSTDGNDIKDRWDITDAGGGYFYVHSAVQDKVWDADSGSGSRLEMSDASGREEDDEWLFTDWDASTRTFKIQNHEKGTWVQRNGSSYRTISSQSSASRFSVNHWQCEVSSVPNTGPTPTLPYAAGTWLHCFDMELRGHCTDFTASRVHTSSLRFNGRLFFWRDSDGDVEAICSTGFDGAIDADGFEIHCVNLTGVYQPNKADVMGSNFTAAIRQSVNQYPQAWGDPHYNEDQNRLFYPTNHRIANGGPQILCWDFDSVNGWCDPVSYSSPLVSHTEDYGFYSEDDCVYGLGHAAIFWAFKASATDSPCTGSKAEAKITPCDCSGHEEYGKLVFDLDLSIYTEFDVFIENSAGTVIWPENWNDGDPGHSLINASKVISLENVTVLPPVFPETEDFLLVRVEVENVPNANGNNTTAGQTFEVRYERSPRLSE